MPRRAKHARADERTSEMAAGRLPTWDSGPMHLVCQRCGRDVQVSADQFEVFERMHYVCFHYEFEHGDADVDQECGAGGCPSASLAGGRDRVIATARRLATEAASGAP